MLIMYCILMLKFHVFRYCSKRKIANFCERRRNFFLSSRMFRKFLISRRADVTLFHDRRDGIMHWRHLSGPGACWRATLNCQFRKDVVKKGYDSSGHYSCVFQRHVASELYWHKCSVIASNSNFFTRIFNPCSRMGTLAEQLSALLQVVQCSLVLKLTNQFLTIASE